LVENKKMENVIEEEFKKLKKMNQNDPNEIKLYLNNIYEVFENYDYFSNIFNENNEEKNAKFYHIIMLIIQHIVVWDIFTKLDDGFFLKCQKICSKYEYLVDEIQKNVSKGKKIFYFRNPT
jgi:hypothetical protein